MRPPTTPSAPSTPTRSSKSSKPNASAPNSPLTGEFKTVNDLNHVLGKLFTLKAQNRISARDAAVLAYIAQLLMQSLRGVKDEILLSRGKRAWERILLQAMEQAFPKPS